MLKMSAQNLSEHDLKILHDEKNNRLIVVCPRLEEWLLETAKLAGIKITSYGLPSDAEKLHERININLKKFEKLLNNLKNNNRMKTLKRLLQP